MLKRFKMMAAVIPLVSLLGVAHAGSVSDYASCTKNPDNSGSCMGTMAGFRDTYNPNDYADFYDSLTVYGFYWSLNGQSGVCWVNAAAIPQHVVNASMASHGSFYVAWDTHGTCLTIDINNDSSSTTK